MRDVGSRATRKSARIERLQAHRQAPERELQLGPGTTSVCPRGCVCHPVRAPGSKVTYAPDTRFESFARNGAVEPVVIDEDVRLVRIRVRDLKRRVLAPEAIRLVREGEVAKRATDDPLDALDVRAATAVGLQRAVDGLRGSGADDKLTVSLRRSVAAATSPS
jgi:hypothetical protein